MEGRLFFANVSRVIDKLWVIVHQNSPQVLLLDCAAIPDIEYTALKSLAEFEEQLQNAGITLWLAALNPEALYMVRHSPVGQKLGDEGMFPDLEEAVEIYSKRFKQAVSNDTDTRNIPP
jgi:SulP family sulfate permease